jgi:hypothetical protein
VFVFRGCLERAVKGFRSLFDVYSAPQKLSFNGFSAAPYSFDLSGRYAYAEAFIESKGYKDGSNLLDGYKEFLAKAYCTSVQFARHRTDHFWFVTNVPFGTTAGRKLTDAGYVQEALKNPSAKAKELLGGATIDDSHVRSLATRLAVGIFTDSFIQVMGTLYQFKPGDTLWSATKQLHAGRIPRAGFGSVTEKFRVMNNVIDPNHIKSGQRLQVPWFGIPEP